MSWPHTPKPPVDVLLLTPPREIVYNLAHDARIIRRSGAYPPLGLAYLAGALEADGERVAILDLAESPVPHEALRAELERFAPSVVGIGSMTFALASVAKLIDLVRETLPEALIVLGGPCMEDYPTEVLRRFPAADLAVVGEGESTLREIVARRRAGGPLTGIESTVYRCEGKTVLAPPRAQPRDLDLLPRPAYRLIDYSRYSPVVSRGAGFATMYTMRGCPYDCRYCHRQSWLRRSRYHSPARVVDEMEYLVRELGVREIKFYDETFTLDRRRTFEVCRLIRERGISVPWEIRTRAELLNQELVRAMADAGCYRICMGVEGGSDERLTRMGRTTRVKHVRDAFRWSRECGLSTLGFFMIGYPGDSRRDYEDVLRLAREIKANWIAVAVTTAYANTEIYKTLLESGRLERDVWREFTLGTLPEIDKRSLTFDGLDYSRDQLDGMLSRLYWRYYLRPGQVARVAREIRSPRQFLNLGRMAFAFAENLLNTY